MAREGVTLDAGALIAIEKRSATMMALFKAAVIDGAVITVPTAVLAQVHRGNSPLVARALAACELEDLTPPRARAVGLLLGAAGRSDVVDAAVVAGAIARRDRVITTDPVDIDHLMATAPARRRTPIIAL